MHSRLTLQYVAIAQPMLVSTTIITIIKPANAGIVYPNIGRKPLRNIVKTHTAEHIPPRATVNDIFSFIA